jgi:hypothetical protein
LLRAIVTQENSGSDAQAAQISGKSVAPQIEGAAIASEVSALRRIAANNSGAGGGATISDVGRGMGGNQVVDRVAGEIQGAVNQANRVLDSGGSGGTRWGAIYQRLNGTGHRLEAIAKGNALQQIAETRLIGNTYMNDAGVIFNRGHVLGSRNLDGNLLRPDFQMRTPGGKVGIFDITTPGQAGKIYNTLHRKHGRRYLI